MNQKVATVFGATGFVGRHVVCALAEAGFTVRAVSRHAAKSYFLRTCGKTGQVVPMAADLAVDGDIDSCVRGADAVVYLPGILYESRAGSFDRVHTQYPARIAQACARHGVGRYVIISALACERGASRYAVTKRQGEVAALAAFPCAVILRPSIIFGHEDGCFGRFARRAAISPFLPLVGGGRTLFQPVYVGDVARAVARAMTMPHSAANTGGPRIYELGGPDVYSFRDLMVKMLEQLGVKRFLVPVPFGMAGVLARLTSWLPRPPLTYDQVTSLKTDNIVSDGSMTFTDMGISPLALDVFLPVAMARFSSEQKTG